MDTNENIVMSTIDLDCIPSSELEQDMNFISIDWPSGRSRVKCGTAELRKCGNRNG